MAPEMVPRGTCSTCHAEPVERATRNPFYVLCGTYEVCHTDLIRCIKQSFAGWAMDGLLQVKAKMMLKASGGAKSYPRGTVSGATAGGFSRRKGLSG